MTETTTVEAVAEAWAEALTEVLGTTDASPGTTTGLQVMSEGTWVPSTRELWTAWTGRRAVWGVEFHGPVYLVGTTDVTWTGSRACPCARCQSTVVPGSRRN